MPETMENTRRWSGFVCPDCRFVFRVPRDHDGKGVVCPSCRRVLKIPSPQDQTPALVVPLPAAPETSPESKRKSRRKKSRRGETHDWDSAGGERRSSSHRDRRQMIYILIGGSGLFALAVAAVLLAMRSNDPPPPVETLANTTVAPVIAAPVFSEAAFLAEAEPLAKRFLEAKTIDELLPIVRHPEITGPRLRALHPDGTLEPAGMTEFNIYAELVPAGAGYTVQLRNGEYAEKTMTLFPSPAGVKIDWESWAGWSEMPWADFIKTRPVDAKLFRVMLGPVDYYNFNFSDDIKWRSYRLVSPDGEHSLYAYVETGSVLDERLRPSPDEKQIPLILSLKYPPDSPSPDQVLVEKWHADGWVLENETEP